MIFIFVNDIIYSMEEQNLNNLKMSLNKKEIFSSLFIIFIELCFYFYMINYSIHHDGWDGMGLIILLPFLDIFAVWGIIKAIKYLRRKKYSHISLILLIFSILSFAPFPFSFVFKSISTPLIERYDYNQLTPEQKIQKQTNIDMANSKHEALIKRYSTLQKVSIVDDEDNVLILENGDIILPINPFHSQTQRDEFISWSKANLINQEVKVVIPDNNFGITYCDEPAASNYGNQTPQRLRQKYNLDPNKGGICSMYSAKVFYDGQALDEKFK